MWFIFALIHMFLMALVNYSDEYLTHSSTVKESKNIHERIGGVLTASVLLTIIGIVASSIFAGTIFINSEAIILCLISSVFMFSTWVGYFYLFQKYSAHKIVALFGLSTLWLLAFEIGLGETISIMALTGVLILVLSSYFIDIGHLKFTIPSSLLISMVGISFCWAMTALLWRYAIDIHDDSFAIYFWHLVGITAFLPIILCMKSYRKGFIDRVKNERSQFLGRSIFNESCSQLSFYFSVVAYALAPLATYVSALGGLQSLFLLLLFYIKPIGSRNSITMVQLGSIVGIAIGIGLLEIF